jgi:hypothetical protein
VLKIRELYKVEFADGLKGALGIDERGQLYWNDEPVRTGQKVTFSWWISLAIILGGLSTFAIALLNVLIYFNALAT